MSLVWKWLVAVVIVSAVAGETSAVALNWEAVHTGGTAAGVMVSAIPAAQDGFNEGRRLGAEHAAAEAKKAAADAKKN